jgi:hypothetical protein
LKDADEVRNNVHSSFKNGYVNIYVIEGFRRGRNVAKNLLGYYPASFFGA